MVNNRILASRRRSLPILQDASLSPESSRQDSQLGNDDTNEDLPIKDVSRFKACSSRLFLNVKKKLKVIKDTGSYCVNVLREWLGYTFCCIIVRKRKTPGVLRSVKI